MYFFIYNIYKEIHIKKIFSYILLFKINNFHLRIDFDKTTNYQF
jgi:hypothetical protein